MEITQKDVQARIARVCQELSDLLIAKNKSYGNSAIDPTRIFSKAGPIEQIHVRIDDKLNRISKGTAWVGDNDIDDLIGYLVLLKVAREFHDDPNPSAVV